MYSVVLIDDEAMIREGLQAIVDWNEYGFEVTNEAGNGILGKSIIQREQPNLVVLDISMPGLDGITMLKQLRQEGFEGKVILLTGYANFEYAKQAIELKVENYLVKPIEKEELINVLIDVKKKLDGQKVTKEVIHKHQGLNKIKIFQNLLFLEGQDQTVDNEFYCEDSSYYVAIIGQTNIDDVKENLVSSVDVVLLPVNEYVLMLIKDKSRESMNHILNVLSVNVEKITNEVPMITCSSNVHGYSEIKDAYENARHLYERRFLFDEQKTIFYDDYNVSTEVIEQKDLDFDSLYKYIEIGNFDEMDKGILTVFSQLKQSSLNVEQIKGLCINCFIAIKGMVPSKYKIAQDQLPPVSEVIDKTYQSESLLDVLRYLRKIFYKLSYDINNGPVEDAIERVLEYIRENSHQNLKLEQIAKLFNYNSSYLGKVFKSKVGMSFNKYLDEIRIEKAKMLLAKNEYKVYQIADMVGFSSPDYFYNKFKKYVGVTPKAYIKSIS